MNGKWTIAAVRTGLCMLLAGSGALPAQAVDTYWEHDPATPGDWFVEANWTQGVPHSWWEDAYICNGGTAQVAAIGAAADYLYLGRLSNDSGAVDLTGTGRLSIGNDEFIGYEGTGTFAQTGGTHLVNNDLYLGRESGSEGTCELSGTGELSVRKHEYVGHSGTGTFTQTGGKHAIGNWLYLGNSSGSQGTYALKGTAELSVGSDEWIGYYGVGAFAQTEGTHTVADELCLGLKSNSQGDYELGGTGRLSVGSDELIGLSGTGAFTQTGGTHSVGGSLNLGISSGGQGTYELSGTGELSVGSDECIGNSGKGTFAQAGGTHSVDGCLYLGYKWGSEGTYDLSGTAELSVGSDEYIGYDGTGAFTQTGGTHAVGRNEYIGHNDPGTFTQTGGAHTVAGQLNLGGSSGSGIYELSGTGQLSVEGDEYIGGEGTGTFTQTGGIHRAGSLYLGYSSGCQGAYQLSGTGQLSVERSEYIGHEGTGTFTQTGGSHTAGYLSVSSGNRYQFSSGTLTVTDSALITGALDFAGGDALAVVGGLVDVVDALLTDTGSASLTLSPDSLLIVAPGFDPAVEFGTFTNLGSIVHQPGSTLTVPAGKGFTGTGTIDDHVACQGTIKAASGYAAGITLNGGVSVSGSGTVDLGPGTLTVEDELSGISGTGQLSVGANEYIGHEGTGTFTQAGGTHTVGGSLRLGCEPDSQGTYKLSGTAELSVGWDEYIGYDGTGTFTQSGGTHAVGRNEYIGYHDTGTFTQTGGTHAVARTEYIGYRATGTFTQTGGTHAVRGTEYVGYRATGTFTQTGGTHAVDGWLYLGSYSGSQGTYELSGTGQLLVQWDERIGYEGTGTFIQTGGTHTVGRWLHLSSYSGSKGTYELSGTGRLSVASNEYIGSTARGIFVQTGGTHTVAELLYVGHYPGCQGTYELSGTGRLLVGGKVYIAPEGHGTFTQTGGSHTVAEDLYLGAYSGSQGTYVISAGQLAVRALLLGEKSGSSGRLNITGAEADISVSGKLSFGPGSSLTAVPGSTIHMTGAELEIRSTDHAAIAGLANLRLIFEGGEEDIDPVEVAGEDIGPVLGGFEKNFALGTLQLGGADIGRIQLVDSFDNRPDWEGTEALYVGKLDVGPGSYLDLNGLNLYYLRGQIDPTATIEGGDPTLVPEPSTITLLLLGIVWLIFCARCSRRQKLIFTICIVFPAVGTLPAYAVDTYWQHNPATPGNWFLGANWTEGVPRSGDYAYINNGGTAEIAAKSAETNYLYLGDRKEDSGTVRLSGAGQLSVAAHEFIGDSGAGTFIQTGGTNAVKQKLFLGYYRGSEGAYELSGTGHLSVATYEEIGSSGTGTFIQTGGTHTVGMDLLIGNSRDSQATYELSGTGELSVADEEYIGCRGTATFTHTAGTHTVRVLYLAHDRDSQGTYALSGTGRLSAAAEYVGYYGTGTFTQTAGTHTLGALCLGYHSESRGSYKLSGTGELSVGLNEYIGRCDYAAGKFTHTGGTHTVGEYLYLGLESRSQGIYDLGGAGQLSAGREYVGRDGDAIFTQTGGSNTTGYLSVNSTSRYQLSGGTLTVTDSAEVTGILVFAGGNASAVMGGLVNLAEACLTDAGSTSFTLSPDSLLIVPAGFDPGVEFGSFTNQGSIVHQPGSTLTVPAGKGFTGTGTINDHVACQGTINAASGYGAGITLNGGLSISGSGSVDLGTVTLAIEDELSGMEGNGQLSVGYSEYIGHDGTGAFSQGGGTHTVGTHTDYAVLYLGYSPGSQGTYDLSGGQLWVARSEYVGYDGTGTFTQTGGTNTIGTQTVHRNLYLGYSSGSQGAYELSGGQLSVGHSEDIGYGGTGTFTQTGGTHIVAGTLRLGPRLGSQGTYALSGTGQLSVGSYEYIAYEGAGTVTQTGGTHTVGGWLNLGSSSGSQGTYGLSGGQLSVESSESIGGRGTGTFTQSGGTHSIVGSLYVGRDPGSQGVYQLSGTGQLSVGSDEYIGREGIGTFTHTGGTHTVDGALNVGNQLGSEGIYSISAGRLAAGSLLLGEEDGSSGTLNIAGAEADISVAAMLHFGAGSSLAAVPGSVIHMTGAALEIESTDPAAMAGLRNLRLIFEGGEDDIDPVEVACQDRGPVLAGFEENFALGMLQLGGADIGRIQLVDSFDNQPGSEEFEALYVGNLSVLPASYLDLGRLNLYYVRGQIDPTATIEGGYPMLIPEPSTFVLLGVGAVGLFAYAWRRRRRIA